ncbi:hypothetical protein [Acinetobacter sp. ANC 4973]|uniref:hypothetical protein n=1 Tax=Acinetobacter sp. ANC 4973 TaxID=1977871 RepID=UPI001D0D3F0D|nr:hypothetical protein [Acinetobacter sp. ANC 4973]
MVYLEPAFRTLESYAEENGDVTHVAEFFENDAGEYARKQYLTRAGGFSSAQDYRRSGLSLVPVNFYGYDYVMQPNYTTNVGMVSCSMDLQYQNIRTALFHVLTARLIFPCYHPLKR